jgi:hypothetical protein
MSFSGLFFGSWRAERTRGANARRYVAALMAEPDAAYVTSLAKAGDGDEDHARWELRYARRAIGLLVAERDALNDLTGSDVAAALEIAHRGDAEIAADRRAVAERQLNERLLAYRTAMADRSTRKGTAERLAAVLLTYAGAMPMNSGVSALGAEIAGAILSECNGTLRETYGEASLPEDRKPSEI